MTIARQSGGPLLSVKDLVVSYDGLTAVRGVDLKVDRGQVVALVGANGSGKSTILNALAGVIPSRGAVVLDGWRASKRRPYKIARAGLRLVPEGRQVFSNLSVTENLEVAAQKPTGARSKSLPDTVDDIYKSFPRLEERADQLAGSLSGGEQQMLAIARALVGEPLVLLLDEPSNGLAPILVQEVFAVLQRLKERGITILIAEQMVGDALALADYAYVIDRGVVQQHGPSSEVAVDPAIVAAYLGGSIEYSQKLADTSLEGQS